MDKHPKTFGLFLFKGYVISVLSRLGINNYQTKPIENDVFAEGIALANGNNVLVEFGTVKKTILKHFDIKQEVFMLISIGMRF